MDWLHTNKVRVYLVPNPHAKIYLNEKTVLVSSMNIHRTSIIDSRDFAMVVKNDDDARVLREYVIRLIGKATITQTSVPARALVSSLVGRASTTQSQHPDESRTAEYGFCVRSHERIRFNTEKPLCADCFRQWNKYQDEDNAEKYCHSCGKSAKTTFARPLCMSCWKKLQSKTRSTL